MIVRFMAWLRDQLVTEPPEGTDSEFWRESLLAFRGGTESWRAWQRQRANG